MMGDTTAGFCSVQARATWEGEAFNSIATSRTPWTRILEHPCCGDDALDFRRDPRAGNTAHRTGPAPGIVGAMRRNNRPAPWNK